MQSHSERAIALELSAEQCSLIVEGRMINYRAGDSNYETAHQIPIILGINWY